MVSSGDEALAFVLQCRGFRAQLTPPLDVAGYQSGDNRQHALGVLQELDLTLGQVDRQCADNLLAERHRYRDEAPAPRIEGSALAPVDAVLKPRFVFDAGNYQRRAALDHPPQDTLAPPVARSVAGPGAVRAQRLDV